MSKEASVQAVVAILLIAAAAFTGYQVAPRADAQAPDTIYAAPAGTVSMSVAGPTEPEGWVFCDGRELAKSEYPDLFTAIGETYGATDGQGGAGSTHFRIPDMRGQFVRGLDPRTSNAVDPFFEEQGSARTVGTIQESAMMAHQHNTDTYYGFNDHGSYATNNAGYGNAGPYSLTPTVQVIDHAGYPSPVIARESRPTNIALRFMIKH